jgi:hypothetical protein
VFRWLGWASIHYLERVAGATAAAVVVLVSTNVTVAAMDEGGGPSSPTVLDAFTESLNSGSVDRSQALLVDDAVIVDHDGQYAGARLRVWLARAVVDRIIVVDGGTIDFLGLGIAERSDCTALAPGRLAVSPPSAAAIPVSAVVPASCFSVALGLLLGRVRRHGRTANHPTRNLLHHLHEATIQRRMAMASATGRDGSDPGSAADIHTSESARP